MMEKGSFHNSPPQTVASDDLVKSIPLPNQLPKGIDFAEISVAMLKSSTVESLITQNEDLMARLTISLRKTNDMEERTAALSRENNGFKVKFEGLRDQFMVLQEKDRRSTARQMQLAEDGNSAREQLQKLEKIYTDLFVQAQALQRRLVRLERYRARVRKAMSPIQEKAKRMTSAESDIVEMRKTLSMAHMQAVNSYEAKLAELKAQLEILQPKAADRDEIYAAKIKVENELVHEQRHNTKRSAEMQEQVQSLSDENASLRMQLKETLLTNGSQTQKLAELDGETEGLREESVNLREQVESLQALWAHKQRELEQLIEKNRSLQNLNQSLSVNLNNQRRDIQNLKSEMEVERFSAGDRIKALTAEIEMLRAEQGNP